MIPYIYRERDSMEIVSYADKVIQGKKTLYVFIDSILISGEWYSKISSYQRGNYEERDV